MTTGSLGQGTSSAAGIATGLKLKGSKAYVYCIVGDGELNEGQCWEPFNIMAHYRMNHCIVIIDDNKKQLDGYTKDIMNPFDIAEKMKAFGFHVETAKGNSVEAIDEAIEKAKQVQDQGCMYCLRFHQGSWRALL